MGGGREGEGAGEGSDDVRRGVRGGESVNCGGSGGE